MLEIDRPDQEDPGDFDPMYLGVGLDAFIVSRAQAAHPTWRSSLSWRMANGCFEVSWDEVPPVSRVRGAAEESRLANGARPSHRGDPLALPLLARVVAAHGGFVETTSNAGFGMTIRWPQFQR
jgi:hypothetical protein